MNVLTSYAKNRLMEVQTDLERIQHCIAYSTVNGLPIDHIARLKIERRKYQDILKQTKQEERP